MIYAVIVIVVIIIGTYLFKSTRKAKLPRYFLNISLLLPTSNSFNAEEFKKAFFEKWQTFISCEENVPNIEPEENVQHFLVRNGKNNIVLSYSNKPFEEEFTNGLIETIPYMSEKEIQSVKNHKAYLMLDYMLGTQNIIERLSFTSQLLLSLLRHTNAAGYINWSSKCYRQASFIEHLYHLDYQDIESLFSIFVNIHSVFTENGYWIHTHGMEQFELPDVEIIFTNESEVSYYTDLLTNVVMYTIEKHAVLKVGDTAELAGDGVIYKISNGSKDPEHPYGAFGAIELLRQN